MKAWYGIVVGLVLGVAGLGYGNWKAGHAEKAAIESAARAQLAANRVQEMVTLLGRVAVERDKFKRQADSLGDVRNQKVEKLEKRVVVVGPAPKEQPDTCKKWIARADSMEAIAKDAIAQAKDTTELMKVRQMLSQSELALANARATILAVKPVLEEHTKVAIPGPSFGSKLIKVLIPVAQVEYGVQARLEAGKIQTFIGPSLHAGWRIEFSLKDLIP